MSETLQAHEMMLATAAGGMVVIFGAVYAFLFAWSKISKQRKLMVLAYLGYLGLAYSCYLLVKSLHLSGFWGMVVAVMLIGYLLAPHAIWNLCVATHDAADQPDDRQPSMNNQSERAVQ